MLSVVTKCRKCGEKAVIQTELYKSVYRCMKCGNYSLPKNKRSLYKKVAVKV